MKNSHLAVFMGGAIVGAAIALLLAPDKGSVTRSRVKNFVTDEFDKYCPDGLCSCGCSEDEKEEDE